MKDAYDWVEEVKQAPVFLSRKSVTQPLRISRQDANALEHNESQSMEAEYKDFMSIELEEGPGCEISPYDTDAKPN